MDTSSFVVRPDVSAAHVRRPHALSEVALWAGEFGGIDRFIREFLDEFYTAQEPLEKQAMLMDEPVMTENARSNAYLAAVAEHLALKYQLEVPPWCEKKERFLTTAFFPSGLESLKAILLVESPAAFRRRMIFVDADPLSRPRRDKLGIG